MKISSPCCLPVGLGREPCSIFVESEWEIALFFTNILCKRALAFVLFMQASKPMDPAHWALLVAFCVKKLLKPVCFNEINGIIWQTRSFWFLKKHEEF